MRSRVVKEEIVTIYLIEALKTEKPKPRVLHRLYIMSYVIISLVYNVVT